MRHSEEKMKKLILLFTVLVASTSSYGSTKVIPSIKGVPVTEMCIDGDQIRSLKKYPVTKSILVRRADYEDQVIGFDYIKAPLKTVYEQCASPVRGDCRDIKKMERTISSVQTIETVLNSVGPNEDRLIQRELFTIPACGKKTV